MTDDMFGAPQPGDVSIDDQIACVIRELGYRDRVYARRVDAGKMNRAQADREILVMQAVLETLKKARDSGTKVLDR